MMSQLPEAADYAVEAGCGPTEEGLQEPKAALGALQGYDMTLNGLWPHDEGGFRHPADRVALRGTNGAFHLTYHSD